MRQPQPAPAEANADDADAADEFERQLEEVQALAAIFGGEDEFSTQSSQLASFIETADMQFVDRQTAQPLSFQLRAALEDGETVLCLSCTLPQGYPTCCPAAVTGSIEHVLAKRKETTDLNAVLQQACAEAVGAEAVYSIVETAKGWAHGRVQAMESTASATDENETGSKCDWGVGDSLVRSFFYCHHIRTKQALVYAWAEELRLSVRRKDRHTWSCAGVC